MAKYTELKPEEWFCEIDKGLEYRRLYGVEDNWAATEALFYNVHDSQAKEAPNIIASTGDAFLSQVNVPFPHMGVKPRRMELVKAARVLESVDNSFVYELGMQNEVEASSLHAYLWGKGILKVGYDSEFGWAPSEQLVTELGPMGMGLTLSQFSDKGRRIEYDANIKPGMPWVNAVLPHDFVVPWGTGRDLSSARWAAHRVVRHIDDVRADSKYDHTRDLEPCMSMEDFVKSYTSVMKPYRLGKIENYNLKQAEGDVCFCELWEIHDRCTGKVFVIATGHDKFLRNEKDDLQLSSGLPFVDVNFVPNARTFWTTSDAEFLRQAQAELTDISRQAMKQRRANTLKFLLQDGAMDTEQEDKLASADVGVFAKVKETFKIQDVVVALNPGQPNVALYQDSEQVRRNAQEVVGFSRNQKGEFEGGRKTATESSIVAQAANMRMDRRQLRIKELYVRTFRIINNIIFANWTTPRFTEVAGQQGAEWISFTGKDLKGDYRYEITFENQDTSSTQARKALALQAYSTMQADPFVDQIKLREFLMDTLNDPQVSELLAQANGANNAALSLQLQGSGMPGGAGGVMQNGGQAGGRPTEVSNLRKSNVQQPQRSRTG